MQKLNNCLSQVSGAAVKQHDQKQRLGERVYLALRSTVHHEKKTRQELKRRPQRNAASQLVTRALAHPPSLNLPRGNTPPNGPNPPTSIIRQENAAADLPIGHLMEVFSHLSLCTQR